MKAFWKSAPLWIKGLVAIIVVLTVFAAIAPSPKARAIMKLARAPKSVMDSLMKAGAIKTYRAKSKEPKGQVVLVWNANHKGRYSSGTFGEEAIEGFDVWELPVNGEKHLTVIDAVHQMTTNPPRTSEFNGSYRQLANPFGYTTPKAKLPNALQRKKAKQIAADLTKRFAQAGVTAPKEVIAYVKIRGEESLFVFDDGYGLYELRNLFSLY